LSSKRRKQRRNFPDFLTKSLHSTGKVKVGKCAVIKVKDIMNNKRYSTDAASQRQRILAWLLTAPLTTTQARTELDVMHPGGRVLELRKLGHKIVTHWQTIDTGKAKHRVAAYVLLSGG
jgi:hypothetical protein